VIRESVHVEPSGIVAIARHYIRDLVYGANDSIIATFTVVAGIVFLVPYMLTVPDDGRLPTSAVLTMASLFGVGAARATITLDRWWKAGFEMLALGGVIALAAYGAGAIVRRVAG
jgi:VIT1/CCC1 family predicted Fe2+/Mn2+ transporter